VIEEGLTFSIKHNLPLHQLSFLNWRTESQMLSGNVEKANASLRETRNILGQLKFAAPVYVTGYHFTKFWHSLECLKQNLISTRKLDDNLAKKALDKGKIALTISKSYAPDRPKIYRLMGEYYWLIGKHKKAFRWWDKSIAVSQYMGALPDLSRAYFQIGKSLMGGKYKHLTHKNLPAEVYLHKAQKLFEEMRLQRDLDAMDYFLEVTPPGRRPGPSL